MDEQDTFQREAYNGADKFAMLGWISLGFLIAWPVIGIILAIYVRVQTVDPASKGTYTQMAFWLTGLALFHMWLLWFTMYAAHNYPQIHPESKC
mmetsp:Transcript_8611/g.14558  ORF Transcript_8611/g.14558 Transcript_8611/m.14558 type:complete len:94 (-) Transcript_8611:192-473(-)|eukprot:CAMPEP_0168626022 /NCGR_PEP_ID=MMETSP0449_2-20121227/10381_1 /TAXON_ID=1082188 /ORGANISM="Strombidium rassoulzadegani, Strain ras09" /LENGTH=93 /DNA_ID=CAMNT_0008667931 /DNA_START=9 /DNA_END=290 /DNA_ORIENTATION=+